MSTLRASVCKKLGLSATASQADVYRAALKKIALYADGRGDGGLYSAKCDCCGEIFDDIKQGQPYPQHRWGGVPSREICRCSGRPIPPGRMVSQS